MTMISVLTVYESGVYAVIDDGAMRMTMSDAVGASGHRTGGGTIRRAGVAVLISVAAIAVGATSAWAASTSPAPATRTVANKASFSGTYVWYSRGDNHGGFQIGGTLRDLDKGNSRGVKFQVKVEGYGPTVYNAATDRDLSVPQRVHYAPSQTVTRTAQYQVCQKNTVTPDDCSTWALKTNPLA